MMRIKLDQDADGHVDGEILVPMEMHEILARVQRSFREADFAFRHFGPQFFIDAKGDVSHGKIFFDQSASDAAPAPWISVAPTTSLTRMARFIDKYWKLPKPEVLITVTGGAQDFNLTARLQQAFDLGIVNVAASAKAWVFSAGTNSGVMRLVGNAMHRYNVKVPVLAVAPWGVCNGRKGLLKERGKIAHYEGSKATREGAPLNPHHTHFIFVDNGKSGVSAWGGEITFRAELENYLALRKGVPIVLLVVQGGPGTVATVHATAMRRNPIVLLIDSGGAAQAIYQYCTGGIEAVDNAAFKNQEDKLKDIDDINISYERQLLTFFTLEGNMGEGNTGTNDMSQALLEAIMKVQSLQATRMETSTPWPLADGSAPAADVASADGSTKTPDSNVAAPAAGSTRPTPRMSAREASMTLMRVTPRQMPKRDRGSEPTPRPLAASMGTTSSDRSGTLGLGRTLILTVNWNQPALARKIIARLNAEQDDPPAATMAVVQSALSKALELHRDELITLFFKLPAISTERINMGKLYSHDTNEYFRSNRILKKRLRYCAADSSSSGGSGFLKHYEMYTRAIAPVFRDLHPILSSVLEASDRTRPHDIFLWLIASGNEGLARLVWPFCDLPIHVSLLGALLAKSLSEKIQGLQARSKLIELSAHLEEWACGALMAAPDEATAHAVLSLQFPRKIACSALDIASVGKSKNFLNQRHCITLMERWWRGGINAKYVLPPDFSWIALFIWTFCPFINPLLYREEKNDESTKIKYTLNSVTNSINFTLDGSRDELKRMIHFRQSEASKEGPDSQLKLNKILKRRTVHEFKSANEGNESEFKHEKESLRDFYKIPAVKFLFRMLVHICACAVYVTLVFTFVPQFRLKASCPFRSWEMGHGWNVNDPDMCSLEPEEHQCCIDANITNPGSAGSVAVQELPLLSQGNVSEILWVLFQLGMWLDSRYQSLRHKSLGTKDQNGGFEMVWRFLDYFVIVALVMRLSMEFFSRFGPTYDWVRSIYELFQVCVSVNVILYFCLLLPFLSELNERLGITIIMLPEMIGDTVIFIIIISIFTLALSFCFCGFVFIGYMDPYNGVHVIGDDPNVDLDIDPDYTSVGGETALETLQTRFWRNLFGVRGAMWAPLWATYGYFDPQDYASFMPSFLMWTWLLIANVLLVNLLVAMFSDTYSRVKTASEVEYQFLKYNRIFEHMHVVTVAPQVINIPQVIMLLAKEMMKPSPAPNDDAPRTLIGHMRSTWHRAKKHSKKRFMLRLKKRTLNGATSSAQSTNGNGSTSKSSETKHDNQFSTTKYFFPGPDQLASPGAGENAPRLVERVRPNLFNFEHNMQDGRLLVDKYIRLERLKASKTLQRMTLDLHSKIETAQGDRTEHSSIVQQKLKLIEEQLDEINSRMPRTPLEPDISPP